MLEMGPRIKEFRKKNNLTQSNLANLMRTTQDTISLWELGKSYPDAENIVRMAKLFRTSADYLLGDYKKTVIYFDC